MTCSSLGRCRVRQRADRWRRRRSLQDRPIGWPLDGRWQVEHGCGHGDFQRVWGKYSMFKADYRAANGRAQDRRKWPFRPSFACLRRSQRAPDDGFSPVDPAVTIGSCRATTLRTASTPTATNALESIAYHSTAWRRSREIDKTGSGAPSLQFRQHPKSPGGESYAQLCCLAPNWSRPSAFPTPST